LCAVLAVPHFQEVAVVNAEVLAEMAMKAALIKAMKAAALMKAEAAKTEVVVKVVLVKVEAVKVEAVKAEVVKEPLSHVRPCLHQSGPVAYGT